jgi:hypothetical protein
MQNTALNTRPIEIPAEPGRAQPQFQRRYGYPPPPPPLVTQAGVLPALLVPVRGKSLADCYETGASGSVFGSLGVFFALIWPIAALSLW